MANLFSSKKNIFSNPAVIASIIAIPSAALIYLFGKNYNKKINFPGSDSSQNLDDNHERLEYGKGDRESLKEAARNSKNVDSMDFEEADFDEETEEEKDYGTCQAISSKGVQCKRKANDESGYCWQHKKIVEEEA